MSRLHQFRQQVEEELRICSSKLGSSPPELYEPIRYILSLGGKRMRPMLVLAGCDLFDGDASKAMPAAMAIELFHNFTLVHDDIMDNAPLRRNESTIHEKWNSNTAILSGDAMLVQAYGQLVRTETASLKKVLDIFNDTAARVCEGQQLDMNYEKTGKISISQYLKMIELKTAALLAGSLKIGAVIGSARDEDADRLHDFGKNMGIAFQLQDDILDVYGGEKFGKQRGGDIISNKKTFLLLKALELSQLNRYKHEELLQWVHSPAHAAKEKIDAVTGIYDFLNVRKIAEAEMKSYFDKGLAVLETIPANEKKKEELAAFAQNLLLREQ